MPSTTKVRSIPRPDDPQSFHHHIAKLETIRMHYVDEGPEDAHTVLFLIHGFPDCWYGWRAVIPGLAEQGYRVIAPSMRGVGESEVIKARRDHPDELAQYTLRTRCLDLALLARRIVPVPERPFHKLIWIGHDWGSVVVSRMALYHAQLVDAVASLCVPYSPPRDHYLSTADLVKLLPQFEYQLTFENKDIEHVMDRDVRKAVILFYQNRGSKKNSKSNLVPPTLHQMVQALAAGKISDAAVQQLASTCKLQGPVLDYYVKQFSHSGFHGGLCSYRVRALNYQDELPFTRIEKGQCITVPFLLITAGNDPVFPREMGQHQREFLPKLTIQHIEDSSHWMPADQPALVVQYLLAWLQETNRMEFAGSIYRPHF